MNAILCLTTLMLCPGGAPNFKDRERHPLAPSLPLLTKEERQKIDDIIERFIQYDIGKLKGGDGKKALDDFNKLGPEATFELINGLNRAANMEASCPAVLIAKKLSSILILSGDIELLTFVKDNVGAGVTAKRHLNVLTDLKFLCQVRRGNLQSQALRLGKAASVMSLPELEKAAGKERGPQLKAILTEVEKRQGVKAVEILVLGLKHTDVEVAKLSQNLLTKNLQRQPAELLESMLEHERRDVRIATAQAVGGRKLRFGAELLMLLQDGDTDVRQAARRALVRLAGVDHGPDPMASFEEREAAVQRWREWWSRQK